MLRLYLQKRGLRESTIKTRLRLAKHLTDCIQPFTEVKVCEYLSDLKSRGITNGYINSVVATVRIISSFNELKWGKNVKYLVNRRTEKQTLSETEIRQFLSVDYYRQRESYDKWQMFWYLVASCGFRCGEVATLKATEVDVKVKLTKNP